MSVRRIGCVGAIALLSHSIAGVAQERPGASVPGVVRDCGLREAELKARWAELQRSREALEKDTAQLERATQAMEIARGRAEMAGAAEAGAYNAQLARHNRAVAANNERVNALNAESARFNAESAGAMADCNRGLRLQGAAEPALEAEERAVLAAVLRDRLGEAGSVVIENRTATFPCSRSLPDLVQFDGCSGMRRAGESPQDVVARLQRALPGLGEAALADLVTRSERRARLDAPLELPVRQVLQGYGEGPAARDHDAIVKVSRVGFDATGSEAVAFVAIRARDARRSLAEYVHLGRGADGRWLVRGRTRAH